MYHTINFNLLPTSSQLILMCFLVCKNGGNTMLEVNSVGVPGPVYHLIEHTPGMFSLQFVRRLNIPGVCSAINLTG